MDADEFLGKLQKLAELLKQGKISEIDINLLIASTPIVDAVEVVHARWITARSIAFAEQCTNCWHCVPWDECGCCHEYKYCPNCGAKMDGGGIKE